MGQLFTRFNTLSLNQRVYLVMCCGMYVYQIYQNILSCYQFYMNTKLITSTFQSMKIYLNNTKITMKKYIMLIDKLKSYSVYKDYLKNKLKEIENLHILLKISH